MQSAGPHTTTHPAEYVLGCSDAEQDRLIRQAIMLAPTTERLLRDAGIGAGQRVLDIGSGVGDVAMIAARLVGPTGEVIGIERDEAYVARAKERVIAAGFRNVTFTQCDVTELAVRGLFDAVVGRLILSYLPDPVAVLRSLVRLLSPGGVVAMQDVAWAASLAVSARVPLLSLFQTIVHQTFARSGVNAEMGLDLFGRFQDAGLSAPHMHIDIPLSTDPDMAALECDSLRALLPTAAKLGVSVEELGDLDTLPDRLFAAALDANSPICYVALASAWARKPY